MNKLYRSPYEAYPFLSDSSEDLRCDFELLTDEMSSQTGLLLAHMKNYVDSKLYEEVLWVCELIYHINPSLRTFLSITEEECNKLKECVDRLQTEVKDRCDNYVLPIGCDIACEAHVLRVQSKKLVRMLYRYMENNNEVPNLLLDIANLLSGYYFSLALKLNKLADVEETPFVSRNYN
jgi:cob(I)alamin adenosyltransferase